MQSTGHIWPGNLYVTTQVYCIVLVDFVFLPLLSGKRLQILLHHCFQVVAVTAGGYASFCLLTAVNVDDGWNTLLVQASGTYTAVNVDGWNTLLVQASGTYTAPYGLYDFKNFSARPAATFHGFVLDLVATKFGSSLMSNQIPIRM